MVNVLVDYTDFSGFSQRFLAISLANQDSSVARGLELAVPPSYSCASFTFRHLARAAFRARSVATGVPRIDELERGRLAISVIR